MTNKKIVIIALILSLVISTANSLINHAVAETATINLPDFYLEDLRLDTPNPKVGEQVLFSAKLKNIGEATIEQWSIKHENSANPGTSIGTYYTDIAPEEYANYPSTPNDDGWLSQGGFVVYEGSGPGEYTFEVILDPNNVLDELNEDNNFQTMTIYVGPKEETAEVPTTSQCTPNEKRCIFFDATQGGPADWVQYCNPVNLAWTNLNECPNGCVDGACVGFSEPVKHKIAYWWGKVNQHTESGEWMTDPDGVSGANINRYTYCKKWYPTTGYAIYDSREFITDWRNAGNTSSFDMEAVTYHCTEMDVISDYETQKKLFKDGQVVPAVVGGEEIDVEIVVSSLRQDFDTCGNSRVMFKINNNYATRFLCVDEYDSVTYDNGRIKVNLENIIFSENQAYAVADVIKETGSAIVEPTVEPTDDSERRERIKNVFRHIRDIKLFRAPRITSKTIEIVTQSGQEYLLYIIRGNYFGQDGDIRIGNKWLHGEVLFRSNNLIIALVDPSVRGQIVVTRVKHAIEMLDSDRDGLPDEWENTLGTDLNNPDSDGDGYEDGIEVENEYDPNVQMQKYTEVDLSDIE